MELEYTVFHYKD